MTMAERLKEKIKLEIAQRILDEGSDPEFVVKVTGLFMKKIKSLQKGHH